ncbi:AMP-binding protein [Xylophilus sp. GW821-FHT01B05]
MTTPDFQPLHIGLHAAAHPDRTAVAMDNGSARLDYAALDRRSRRLAVHLRREGLARGDHIAVLMRNNVDYFSVCWAAQRCGLYFTPVNWHLAVDEVAYIIEDCGARALIVSPTELEVAATFAHRLPQLSIRLVGGAAQGGFDSLDRILDDPLNDDATLDEIEGQPMFYSSGTTGRPKGIKRPAAAAAWGSPGMGDKLAARLHDIDANAVLLSLAPLYHAAPLSWAMAALRYGGQVVVMPTFKPAEALTVIAHHQVTHVQFVPTMFVRLLELPEAERRSHDLSSLRMVVHAAAPCPVEVKQRMLNWFGPIIHEYYAGSENNGLCAAGPQDWLSHPGTVGRALFGQVHVLDESEDELPVGEIGVIYFSGTPRFEYHNDPQKTQRAFSKQGWSTLGDFGHVDAEGFVYLADRRTDLIISGGVNIYPRETEEALMAHPAVHDAAVVGAPSAEFGEDVLAVVELHAGVEPTAALAQELIDFCRARIAHFKCPRRVAFDTLPRTPTGKLLRRIVKEQRRTATTATV